MQVEQLLVFDGHTRITAALPGVFFHVTIIDKRCVRTLGAQMRQQEITQLAMCDEDQINGPGPDEVLQKLRILSHVARFVEQKNIRSAFGKTWQPRMI